MRLDRYERILLLKISVQLLIGIGIAILIVIAFHGCTTRYIKPPSTSTPTERIEQLYYLIGEGAVGTLLDYPENIHQAVLDTFWNYQDPTPLTPLNELRDEYYMMIDLCLIWFDGCTIKGWKTDRGKTLMVLGRPDFMYIEPLDQYSMGSIQVWRYNHWGYRLYFQEIYPNCYVLLNPPFELIGW